MFVRNCWYAAGWSKDFAPDRPAGITILNESIVVYRKSDGAPAALQDRCCHRFAPLSMGRVEGDNLRCMYHGLKFAPSGKCIEIPGQSKIPPQACVQHYPVADKYSLAWIWMGDPALADESLIPDFVGVDDPTWAMKPGRMDYQANFMLINDNLLDLSHIPFLHRNSLGASLTPEGISKPTITKMARGVRIQNWLKGGPSRMIPSLNNVHTDILQTYDFVIPGVFLLSADFYLEGAAGKFPDGLTMETEPIHRQFTCQAVTPLTNDTTCYFFAYGPWAKEAQLIDSFYELSIKAFNEDRVMIEAQQKNINASNGAKMLTTSSDGGLSQFRRMMDEFIRTESQNGNGSTLSANGR